MDMEDERLETNLAAHCLGVLPDITVQSGDGGFQLNNDVVTLPLHPGPTNTLYWVGW
jgi:hypothetical protein